MSALLSTLQKNQRQSIAGELTPFNIPNRKTGPITSRLLKRTLTIYFSIFTVSLAVLVFTSSTQLHALALGMMFPGGGLLYLGHYILFLLTAFLFIFTLTGHYIWTPTLWTAAALYAAGMHHAPQFPLIEYLLPVFCVGLVVYFKINSDMRFKKSKAKAEAFNQLLTERTPNTIRSAMEVADNELSLQDRQQAKAILNRALQPLDQFNGFNELEPFGTSSLRYQLNFAQYALALLQYSHAPAFQGYLSEGQKNLILKMTDKKAWKYWKPENMWGNLDTNPDPIVRDNIMFSGYLGVMLGTYATATGDNYFNEKESLKFTYDDKTEFVYDLPSIAKVLHKNFDKAPLTLFPCEPHWVYTMCNAFGLNALLLNDRINGGNKFGDIKDRFEKSLSEEFMSADGGFITIRSSAWGISLPTSLGEINDAFVNFLVHPLYPSLTERSWESYRYTHFEKREQLHHKTEKMRMFDPGNYKLNRVAPMAAAALAAKEVGDMEIYNTLMDTIEKLHPPVIDNGELQYEGVSNWATFQLAMARFMRPGAFYDIMNNGADTELTNGPQLKEAPYPEVFVGKAYVKNAALHLLLHADEKPANYKFKLSNLTPECEYIVKCKNQEQHIHANSSGESIVHIHIENRSEVKVFANKAN